MGQRRGRPNPGRRTTAGRQRPKLRGLRTATAAQTGMGLANPQACPNPPCMREEPPHDEALLSPVVFLGEHGGGVPGRRLLREFGLGEDAHFRPGQGLLRAVDVGEAGQLATDRVADKARHVGVPEAAGQFACRSGAVPGDDVGLAGEIYELEEDEAVTARAHDGAAVGVEVDEVGGARGLSELGRRAPSRRVGHLCSVEHRPRTVRGGCGEVAAEVAGDGGGEAHEAPERHLAGSVALRKWISGGGVVLTESSWGLGGGCFCYYETPTRW
jgi:hypothetical protein